LTPDRRWFPYSPELLAAVSTSLSLSLRSVLNVAHLALWKVTRVALLVWGVLNGLGIGLLGKVERVKQRISRRVPRVSGSATL
jgi:hypothetical protein